MAHFKKVGVALSVEKARSLWDAVSELEGKSTSSEICTWQVRSQTEFELCCVGTGP